MFITLLVSLYTSRVVLDVLGVEDYGIYGIAGSIIVLFSFLSNALTGSSQRFFSYELGQQRSNITQLKQTFSVSLISHVLIALVILLLCESIGLWYFKNYLVIPEERIYAATVTYHLSVLTFIVNVIRIPYNALIISHEKMGFFAYLSIVEVVMKLLIVFLLKVTSLDKLIMYAILMLGIAVLCTVIYMFFSVIQFKECTFELNWNSKIFKRLMSYTGWSFCVNMANVTTQQGGNLLLNKFFGVLINASYTLATQVSGIIYSFVTNFQMAFRPQIVKLYASGSYSDLWDLVIKSSRISFYLLLMLAVPCVVNAEYVFSIWLTQIPEYSVTFSKLIIFYCIVDAIQAPLWMVIEATGRIKAYSIWLTAILIFNLPLAYIILRKGGSPSTFLIIRLAINVITAIIRTIYMKYFIAFPSGQYIKATIRCFIIFIVALGISYAGKYCLNNITDHQIWSAIFSLIFTLALICGYGLRKDERKSLVKLFFKK